MSNDLPQGWQAVSLGEIAKVEWGNTNITKKSYVPAGFPAFSATGQDGFLTHYDWEGNAVILSAIGARCGKCFLANGKWTAIKNTIVIQGDSEFIDHKLLFHFLNDEKRWEISGSGQPFITMGTANEVIYPLAPLNEQHRISSKLEDILVKVEAGQKRLVKIPVLLKRLRQSILAAACSGRLTSDWREQNPTKEKIKSTIEAIRKRREAEVKTVAQGKKVAEIFSVSEEGDSGELPENWQFIALSKLCSSFDYGTSAKSEHSGKIPVLRMGNIQGGEIDWTDLVYTSDKEEIKSYLLQPNTVLFNRTNSPELVGKTAIYRGERPAIFAGYLIRANSLPELDPEYLNFCLNSSYAKAFCAQVKTDGVSQSNINAQKLGAFEVPFCLLSEQREIVRRVKALFVLADKIEVRYMKAQSQVNKLTQSILAKAFRGELVLQDPNDEPVEQLLKQIVKAKTGKK